MKNIFLLLLLFIYKIFCEERKILEGIFEMTDKNYLEILNQNDAMLIYFFAEGSKKCKEMNQEIKKLHDYIKAEKLDVLLAKVDVSKEENVAVEFGVESIPKLRFVRYKYKIKNDYGGKKNFDEIKEFVNKFYHFNLENCQERYWRLRR